MGKKEKLIRKLVDTQKAMTMREVDVLLAGLGYSLRYGEGSRIKYINTLTGQIIDFHMPHNSNEVPGYVRKQIVKNSRRQVYYE